MVEIRGVLCSMGSVVRHDAATVHPNEGYRSPQCARQMEPAFNRESRSIAADCDDLIDVVAPRYLT